MDVNKNRDVNKNKLTSILSSHVGQTGGLITGLRAAQEAFGFLPPETDAIAADAFNVTRAEVKGVISFYEDFHREPKGKTVVRLCAAEACQAVGSRSLQHDVEKHFAVKSGETNASKELTIEPVYCLGLCSCAPAAMVGDKLVGRASVKNIARAVESHRKADA